MSAWPCSCPFLKEPIPRHCIWLFAFQVNSPIPWSTPFTISPLYKMLMVRVESSGCFISQGIFSTHLRWPVSIYSNKSSFSVPAYSFVLYKGLTVDLRSYPCSKIEIWWSISITFLLYSIASLRIINASISTTLCFYYEVSYCWPTCLLKMNGYSVRIMNYWADINWLIKNGTLQFYYRSSLSAYWSFVCWGVPIILPW